MKHLDEGTIHAWLDGALPDADARAAEAHVATCAECSALVAEARGLIAGSSRILGALDDVPAVQPKRGAVPAPAAPLRSWQASPWVTGIAAALILAVGVRAYFDNQPAEDAVASFAHTEPIREQLKAPPLIDSSLRDRRVEQPRLDSIRQVVPRPTARADVARRASGAGGVAATADVAATSGAAERKAVEMAVEKKEVAAEAPRPSARLAAPVPSPAQGFAAANVPAPVSENAMAGCYRLPASRLDEVTVRSAPQTAARTSRAPAAAPAPVAARMEAPAMPAVVQLDTTMAPQGRVIRVPSTGAVLGYWSQVGRDSARMVFTIAEPITVSVINRLTCPSTP